MGAAIADGEDGATSAPQAEPVTLTAEEQVLVRADLDVLLPTLDGERAERFAALRHAVVAGTIPVELGGALEALLELTLQTGRARARYRADGEGVLTKVYRRTAAGRGLQAHMRQVNTALGRLEGEQITSVKVGMRTVGHFTIAIQTDRTTLTLATRPDTINVESVAVGA